MSEVRTKLEKLRHLMQVSAVDGVILRGVDWFAWATAGGSSSVIMTAEVGIAEVFITQKDAWVLTSRVEHPRLREEEVPAEFEIQVMPWQDASANARFITEKIGVKGILASDRPLAGEKSLTRDMQMLKRILVPEEIQRYREISRSAAEAMTAVMLKAEPGWTEYELAGAGAEACWSRGLEPTLVLVAGAKRGLRHRHPIAKDDVIGKSAMMVFCARRYGLYANFTRFVSFEKISVEKRDSFQKLMTIEAAAFQATKSGAAIREIYRALEQSYQDVGHPEELNLHHQGGPCGYLSRDLIATPHTTLEEKAQENMAFAWNPSFSGAKVEDTVVCTSNDVEILTVDPKWPTVSVSDRNRPDIMVRT